MQSTTTQEHKMIDHTELSRIHDAILDAFDAKDWDTYYVMVEYYKIIRES